MLNMDKTNTIGELLIDARNKRDVSLEEIANRTKININILRSLENNELDKLPNKTYVKGFVQNYAREVGLDVEQTVDTLNATYKSLNPVKEIKTEVIVEEVKTHELTPEQLAAREKLVNMVHNFFSKKNVIIISVVLVSIVVIKGLVGFFSKVSNEQVQIAKVAPEIRPAEENLFDIDAAKKIQAITETKEVAQEPSTTEESKAQEVIVEEKTPETKEEVTNLPAGKLPYRQFTPAPANMYEILPNAVENIDDNLIPQNIRESVVADKENIFIHAVDGDSWISYKTDDEKIKRFVLKQGRHILIRGEIILLFMGNAGASKIFYNNQLVKFKTSSGVKSLIFPQEEIPNHELPLFPSYNDVLYTVKEYKEKMVSSPSN